MRDSSSSQIASRTGCNEGANSEGANITQEMPLRNTKCRL